MIKYLNILIKKPVIITIVVALFLMVGLCLFKNLCKKYPVSRNLDQLHLTIHESSYSRLKLLKDLAISNGRLERTKRDYVPVSINYNGTRKNGKIRLKGDWLDHLENEKWSFNVILNDPLDNGFSSFHIQNPKSRYFLNEFVYHKLLQKEGILSPEYKFIQVYLNKKSLGIYAFEENLTTKMITAQSKPIGPIFKFKDDIFFEDFFKPTESKSKNLLSKAKFKLINKDLNNHETIHVAKKIMRKYQMRDSTVYDYFDLDLLAKYYVICDITRAYHAMGWINIRFFYNTKSNKMEPIGYDGYSGSDYSAWAYPYLGFQNNILKFKEKEAESIILDCFSHPKMYPYYYKYLSTFNEDNINQFLLEINEELKFYQNELGIEFTDYEYDTGFIKHNIKDIQNNLLITVTSETL